MFATHIPDATHETVALLFERGPEVTRLQKRAPYESTNAQAYNAEPLRLNERGAVASHHSSRRDCLLRFGIQL
jgi:hypothetical protein